EGAGDIGRAELASAPGPRKRAAQGEDGAQLLPEGAVRLVRVPLILELLDARVAAEAVIDLGVEDAQEEGLVVLPDRLHQALAEVAEGGVPGALVEWVELAGAGDGASRCVPRARR